MEWSKYLVELYNIITKQDFKALEVIELYEKYDNNESIKKVGRNCCAIFSTKRANDFTKKFFRQMLNIATRSHEMTLDDILDGIDKITALYGNLDDLRHIKRCFYAILKDIKQVDIVLQEDFCGAEEFYEYR